MAEPINPRGTTPIPTTTPTPKPIVTTDSGAGSDRLPSHDQSVVKPDRPAVVDVAKLQYEMVRRLGIIINDMRAHGIEVPEALINQFKSFVTAYQKTQALARQ